MKRQDVSIPKRPATTPLLAMLMGFYIATAGKLLAHCSADSKPGRAMWGKPLVAPGLADRRSWARATNLARSGIAKNVDPSGDLSIVPYVVRCQLAPEERSWGVSCVARYEDQVDVENATAWKRTSPATVPAQRNLLIKLWGVPTRRVADKSMI